MADNPHGWPMFFAAKALDAKRVKLRQGELFPWQDRSTIRGLSKAYGFPEGGAPLFPFAKLPFVLTLDVGTYDLAVQIRDQGLTYAQVKRMVESAKGAQHVD
jgi:hypothetical protein